MRPILVIGPIMFVEQLYLGCLAQASYFIADSGEAAVVDPRRDVDDYIALAEREGCRIKFVLETHLHADFVSGHRELAERTGATVVMSARAGATFPHKAVGDGDELRLGSVRLRFLETPGHTPESVSILAYETPDAAAPKVVFTGDTLFIGDVGRPDLAGARGITAQAMAGMLYDSLHGKLLTLPDDVVVYPAHGAGSLCGKNISKETWSTVGEQRRTNHALQPMSRDSFVRLMTTDLPEVPAYFGQDVAINRAGAASLDDLAALSPLTSEAFAARMTAGAVALDVRTASDFAVGHVEGSINIGHDGQLASWAGTLLPLDSRLVLVAESPEAAAQARVRLARVGIEGIEGFLEGGVDAWRRSGGPVRGIEYETPERIAARLDAAIPPQILDVRRRTEYDAGHLENAVFLPLDRLAAETPALERSRPVVVVCAGGYRASTACSLLESRGYRDLVNLAGGMAAWTKAGGAVTTAPEGPSPARG